MSNNLEHLENGEDITSISSEKHVICIQESDNIYKTFQIIFEKKGSIFINFPYYLQKRGSIGLVTVPGNSKFPLSLNFGPTVKVTSNLVKYSHHPDGEAHFSQSGKIFTVIRKKSIPLKNLNGHLFTLLIQGLKDFEIYDSEKGNDKSSLKTKNLILKLPGQEPEAIKIVGRLFTKRYFQSLLNEPQEDPRFLQPKGVPVIRHRIQKNVYQYCGWILRPPQIEGYENYVLVISYKEIPKMNEDSYSGLTFIGGFDGKAITRNHSLDTTFLSFIYPIPKDRFEILKKEIGCIDRSPL
ncbi:MAG: hypothetical protein WCX63_06490 [Methanoregula sp.]